MSWHDFTVRILVALLAGSLIGLERQWRQRRAGLRTNALVSTGSAAFVSLACMIPDHDSPTRMAAQVVSGIGFLGAGVILREGLNVRGLNSAATLWCSAAVGTLAGMGFLVPSMIATSVIVAANILLRPLGVRISRHDDDADEIPACYRLQVNCLAQDSERIRRFLMQELSDDNMLLKSLRTEKPDKSGRVLVQVEVITAGRHDRQMERVITRLNQEPEIMALSWEVFGSEELVCNLE